MRRLLLLGLLYCAQQLFASQLEKVYLQQTPLPHDATDIKPDLELAKLVFYFNNAPVIKSNIDAVQDAAGFKHETYLFAQTQMNDALHAKLKEISQTKHPSYVISCTYFADDQQSLKVDFYYDPKAITCCVDQCDTITHHKGVVFRLVNKKLVDELSLQTKPLIQLARVDPPKIIIDCGYHRLFDAGMESRHFFGSQAFHKELVVF